MASYYAFAADKFDCRYEQVHLYNPNFILSSHDFWEQKLLVVFDRLNQEFHVVFLKVGNIMESVVLLCFCYVWETVLEGYFSWGSV